MKILLTSIGTYGDIVPILSYANHLKQIGHEVTICSTIDWEEFIKNNNHTFIALAFDFKKLTLENASVIGKAFKSFYHFKKQLNEINKIVFNSLHKIAQNYDLIIGAGVQFSAFSIAEANNIAYKHILHSPVWLNSPNYTPPIINKQFSNKLINNILWKLFIVGINSLMIKNINRQRQKMGLLKINNIYYSLKKHLLISCDSNISKIPDGNIFIKQIPYIYFENKTDLPTKIQTFLSCKTPVIYFGFGSMPSYKKIKLLEIIVNVVKKLKCKAIIQKGWSAMYTKNITKNILYIKEELPHEKLFKKLSLVVHHGGAGTVHNAARAGVVQLIIPHMLDQFYFGNIIYTKKIGAKPLQLNKLSEEKLYKSISSALNNQELKSKAKEFSMNVLQENDFVKIDDVLL